MTGRTLKRDRVNLPEALSLLLHGTSLRKLANRYGCTHTYMCTLLQQHYGKDITNPDVTSLARSLIADNRGNKATYEYALSVAKTGSRGERFRSTSALDAATCYLTLDEPDMINYFAYTIDADLETLPVWGFLRWFYLYHILNYLVVSLEQLANQDIPE